MCMVCDCDREAPVTFYREDIIVARKTHRCVECQKKIPVGAQYRYIVGKWTDGDPKDKVQAMFMCMECDADWKRLTSIASKKEAEEACELFGQLREAVDDSVECGCLNPDDELVKKWCPETFQEYEKYMKNVATWKELGFSFADYLAESHPEEILRRFELEKGVSVMHRDDPGQQYFSFCNEN